MVMCLWMILWLCVMHDGMITCLWMILWLRVADDVMVKYMYMTMFRSIHVIASFQINQVVNAPRSSKKKGGFLGLFSKKKKALPEPPVMPPTGDYANYTCIYSQGNGCVAPIVCNVLYVLSAMCSSLPRPP